MSKLDRRDKFKREAEFVTTVSSNCLDCVHANSGNPRHRAPFQFPDSDYFHLHCEKLAEVSPDDSEIYHPGHSVCKHYKYYYTAREEKKNV